MTPATRGAGTPDRRAALFTQQLIWNYFRY